MLNMCLTKPSSPIPNWPQAYTLRGFSRTMQEDYGAAMEDFQAALAMEAINARQAYAFRSYAHSMMGNYDQAFLDVERALNTWDHGDEFARADAEVAKIIAQYRSGDYGAINRHVASSLPASDPGATSAKDFAPYGLTNLFRYVNIDNHINQINEADTQILLNPDDALAYARRAGHHARLRWDAMVVQDITKAVELDSVHDSLYVDRARAWARMGDFRAIVENQEGLDPSKDMEAGILLAIAHWRVGDLQQAIEAIEALDYMDPRVVLGLEDDFLTRRGAIDARIPKIAPTHLAVRGMLLAEQGRLGEGLKFLHMPVCNDKVAHAMTDPETADNAPLGATMHADRRIRQVIDQHLAIRQVKRPGVASSRGSQSILGVVRFSPRVHRPTGSRHVGELGEPAPSGLGTSRTADLSQLRIRLESHRPNGHRVNQPGLPPLLGRLVPSKC